MTPQAPTQSTLFKTRLVPYRSLTPRECNLFILLFGAGTFVLSLPFFFMGAWPVAGFMGLDVLALYVALRMSYYSARAYETLDLTPLELVFVKIGAGGERAEWRFDTYWVRLEQQTDDEFGTQKVSLVFRGQSVEVGSFLGPEQKAELAKELSRALSLAKRGVDFG